MPKRYEEMRDAFIKQGMSEEAAKTKAARIYNATRKKGQRPVTRNYEEKSHKRSKKHHKKK